MRNPDNDPLKKCDKIQDIPLFPRMPSSMPIRVTKKDLEDIIERLDRIEKGLRELTVLQLINGVWI